MRSEQKLTHGFKDDIQEIVGIFNGYIFLSTANSEDKGINWAYIPEAKREYTLDVISPDLKYYRTLSITTENYKDISWVTLIENKLIMEMKNDDIGHYVKIFDIEIQ